MKTAHLVKVLVQTVWVEIDSDSGHATEKVGTPVVVPAENWEGFYTTWKESWDNEVVQDGKIRQLHPLPVTDPDAV
jgi:hypothetical protein